MTPMLLVTGVLGSGKTTLLKEIAAHRGDRKFAFLVNEFSPTDIDGEEVSKVAPNVVAIPGGEYFLSLSRR